MLTLLTLDEAAKRLRISRRSLQSLIAAGRVRAVHPVPGRTCVAESEVDAYISSLIRKIA